MTIPPLKSVPVDPEVLKLFPEGRIPMRKTALEDIAAERQRQIDVEGWQLSHDDTHEKGELARAAGCYAFAAAVNHVSVYNHVSFYRFQVLIEDWWPWNIAWFKTGNLARIEDQRRSLVKAGALIVAEIERLDRANGN